MINNQVNFGKINNFFSTVLVNVNDYNSAINALEKLSMLFTKYKYNIKVDTIIDLIEKNNSYRRCIEIIFNKNKRKIINGKAILLFKNELILSSIDVYCMINNINVKEFDDFRLNEKDSDGLSLYIDDIRCNKVLSCEEEQELIRRVKKGEEEAKRLFIESNLKLVIEIALKYRDRGLPIQDLIQEGNIGLMVAIDGFDPDRGFKFSTYAYNWIRQRIVRALSNYSRTIRYPVYLIEQRSKILRTRNNLTIKLNREPTLEEIANELRISEKIVKKIYNIQSQPISLNELIGEDSDHEFSCIIPDPNASVEDKVINKICREEIRKLVDSDILKEREKEIVKYRFGFYSCGILTFDEIGHIYGITRQRVKQIEETALLKLYNSYEMISFESYKDKPDSKREAMPVIKPNTNNKYIRTKTNSICITEYKTIYEVFNEYSKEEIDFVVDSLDETDRKLFVKVFGNDLSKPYLSSITLDENSRYYNILLPKMDKLLRRNHYKMVKPPVNVEEMSALLSNGLKEKEMKKKQEVEEVSYSLFKTYEFDLGTKSLLDKLKNALSSEDYNRLYELMVRAKQNSFLSKVSSIESIILFLSLGYINNKYFMFDELAKYLEIEENELREIVMKSLKQYQNDIMNSMDEIVTSNNKRLSLTK